MTLHQKHESVEVYTVRLLAWPLRRRGNHPVAYFNLLNFAARTVALLKQKNSSLSTDSSTSTVSGNKTSGKAVLVANHAVHWSSKLYKASKLYCHANLLRLSDGWVKLDTTVLLPAPIMHSRGRNGSGEDRPSSDHARAFVQPRRAAGAFLVSVGFRG